MICSPDEILDVVHYPFVNVYIKTLINCIKQSSIHHYTTSRIHHKSWWYHIRDKSPDRPNNEDIKCREFSLNGHNSKTLKERRCDTSLIHQLPKWMLKPSRSRVSSCAERYLWRWKRRPIISFMSSLIHENISASIAFCRNDASNCSCNC